MQVVSQVLDFTSKFEACKVPYMVTGSVAGIVYGDPRLTNDVDVVLEIDPEGISQLTEAFPANEYYCPPEEVIRLEAARDLRGHFNLVRNDTGFKADIYLMGSDPLHQWAMERKRCIELGHASLWLAPPEYVILRKMEFYQEGKSSKHITDIQAILKNMADQIDQKEIESMAKEKGLSEIWRECRKLP